MAAAVKGYRCILVYRQDSDERSACLAAYGAEI